MILAAGLSPAWQQILRFNGLHIGEVNRAEEAHWCASGKVLNVGLGLHRLGAPSFTLSPLSGPAFAPIEAEFAAEDVPHHWVATKHPTCVCTTIVDWQSNQTTELVENAAGMSESELAEFQRQFVSAAAQASLIVLTGSLPAGAPSSYFADLLAAVDRRPTLLDFRGPELIAALAFDPWLVKPNAHELEVTLGSKIDNENELGRAMLELQSRGARSVLITAGAEPAWLLTPSRRFYRIASPKVTTLNAIGCGDALTSGLAAWLEESLRGNAAPQLTDERLLAALPFAFAMAAHNASTLLPARPDRAFIEQLAAEVEVTEASPIKRRASDYN